MKKASLQKIQDFYENQGFKGAQLREALKKDKEWISIMKDRKAKLSSKIKLNKSEQSRYVLSTKEDFEILEKVKKLEKINLNKEEVKIVALIKTQLEHDWRVHLIKKLDEMMKKYERSL